MADEHLQLPHKLTLNERSVLNMTGVTEVVRFDEDTIVLHTSLGTLTVHGAGLQLKTLSLEGGQVAVDGTIHALIYQNTAPDRSLWQRLFR